MAGTSSDSEKSWPPSRPSTLHSDLPPFTPFFPSLVGKSLYKLMSSRIWQLVGIYSNARDRFLGSFFFLVPVLQSSRSLSRDKLNLYGGEYRVGGLTHLVVNSGPTWTRSWALGRVKVSSQWRDSALRPLSFHFTLFFFGPNDDKGWIELVCRQPSKAGCRITKPSGVFFERVLGSAPAGGRKKRSAPLPFNFFFFRRRLMLLTRM